jgi:hypothetical protein
VPTQFPPAIIDIEASGFGSSSYPIEVGFVLPDGTSYCALIHPAANWQHWDESAERVHQVSRKNLEAHGRPVAEVAHELNGRLQGQTIYCDAWYHDYTWLSRLFDAAGSAQAFRLEDVRILLNETQAAHWHATKVQIQRELDIPRHRASNDARILQATLARVRALYSAPARTRA